MSVKYDSYINSIVQDVAGDFSRPAKFSALVTLPQLLETKYDTRVLDLLCKTISIPSIVMEPLQVKYRGHTIPVMGRVNPNQTFTVSFMMDESNSSRQLFVDWMESLDNKYTDVQRNIKNLLLDAAPGSNITNLYLQFGEIIIKSLDWNEKNTTMNYRFIGCFPTEVTGPEFATDSVSQIQEFSVTFSYNRLITDQEGDDYAKVQQITEDAVGAAATIGGSLVTDVLSKIEKNNFFADWGSNDGGIKGKVNK